MNAQVAGIGNSVKQDPAGALKALLFILLALLVLVVVYKFLKGINKASTLISELGPSTEEEKRETIETPAYQDNLKWLDDKTGIETIARKGHYKTVSAYLQKMNLSWSAIGKAAEAIWKSKFPGYISETEVYNAVASMPSKAAVSLLAMEFNAVYKKSFGFYPLNVFLGKYLKLPEMKTLTEIIDKKPEL